MLRRLNYKYVVAIVFVMGLFMDLIDMTITNVALPTLGRVFQSSDPTTIEWVVTGYLLSLAVFIPVSGWAGDRFGTKRVFLFALAVFTTSSLLCALSWSIESLVVFRVLQGIGGGMMTPVSTAMLFRAFPPQERARASSILILPTVIAPASGPVLGGFLTEYVSWHWIFLINLPIGLLAILISALYLREERQSQAGRFDLPGFVLSAVGFATIVYALSRVGAWGFGDSQVIGFGLAGVLTLAAWVAVELRVREPMINLRLFRDKLFAASNAVNFVTSGGLQGAIFLLPLFLQAEKGFSPLESGLTTFPMALGTMAMSPLAGRMYPRIGPRRMLMLGLTLIALNTFAFLLVDLETNAWWIRAIMFTRGWAFSMTLLPLQTATFATIKLQDTGRASSIFNVNRQLAASVGVALLATVLSNRLAAHGVVMGNPAQVQTALFAFHDGYLVSGLLALIGVAAALLVDDRLAASTMRRIPEPREAAPEPVGAGR